MQSLLYISTLLKPKTLAFCLVNSKILKSSVEKIMNNLDANYHFFELCLFFYIQKYHYEFQINSRKILATYGYRDVILQLTHLDDSEVILTITKVS